MTNTNITNLELTLSNQQMGYAAVPYIGYSFGWLCSLREPSAACLSPVLSIAAQPKQVRRLISRSREILSASRRLISRSKKALSASRQLISRSKESCLTAELSGAIACCKVAKMNGEAESLRYILVGEATSAKFYKLRSQEKFAESKAILRYMARLEEELGGRLYTD